jgi:hypothetical protein
MHNEPVSVVAMSISKPYIVCLRNQKSGINFGSKGNSPQRGAEISERGDHQIQSRLLLLSDGRDRDGKKLLKERKARSSGIGSGQCDRDARARWRFQRTVTDANEF